MIWINYKKWFSMILVKLSTLLIEKGSHKQHTMPTALIGEWALWSFKVFNWFELSWCTLVHLCKYITKYLQPMHLAIWRKAKCTAEHDFFFFLSGKHVSSAQVHEPSQSHCFRVWQLVHAAHVRTPNFISLRAILDTRTLTRKPIFPLWLVKVFKIFLVF